jgi:hypothetical protein
MTARPTTHAPHLAALVQLDDEPSPVELAEIEAAWPVLAAELAVVDAECRLAAAPRSFLARRVLRRALARLDRAVAVHPYPSIVWSTP